MKRIELLVVGTVQGVGFRPRVRRAALARGISGSVRNSLRGVEIAAQGDTDALDAFVHAVVAEAAIERRVEVPVAEEHGFAIAASACDGEARASLPPDLAPCATCRAELAGGGRRHRYPFTSCTACGPRASIALAAPWDRARTTMAAFAPCAACAAEYADPADHRCHAQTIACPQCGPRLWLETGGARGGERVATGEDALRRAGDALRAGKIVALQGVGGWQLLVDATDEAAVAELRRRKRREARPFAVLFGGLEAVEQACLLDPADRAALTSPAAPIALVRARLPSPLARSVAPSSRLTGALLPASPLHALLSADVAQPLVCTSGNLADEPLCIEPADARRRLSPLADLLLGNDRPIARPIDDSVVRGRLVIRRARGYAPRALPRHEPGPVVLALGAHLKATVALALRDEIWVSAHIGDLGSPEAIDRLERTAHELVAAAGVRPDVIACDRHPALASTLLAERLARDTRVPLAPIQHHAAHVAAIAAERDRSAAARPLLGLAWDGMGLGDDGALWGGELIWLDGARADRVAHLRPFALPGGETAIREPRRAALGLCAAGELPRAAAAAWFTPDELAAVEAALARRVNAPLTTSVGRLFDAVAALVGLRGRSRFEAEAASELEQIALDEPDDVAPYAMPVASGLIDWIPTVREILDDRRAGTSVARIAARFHAALAAAAVDAVHATGHTEVALAGGCFQNARLVRDVTRRLAAAGITAITARELPPGDGGLAVGQTILAARRACVPRDPG